MVRLAFHASTAVIVMQVPDVGGESSRKELLKIRGCGIASDSYLVHVDTRD